MQSETPDSEFGSQPEKLFELPGSELMRNFNEEMMTAATLIDTVALQLGSREEITAEKERELTAKLREAANSIHRGHSYANAGFLRIIS
jgi:hypothetical protein